MEGILNKFNLTIAILAFLILVFSSCDKTKSETPVGKMNQNERSSDVGELQNSVNTAGDKSTVLDDEDDESDITLTEDDEDAEDIADGNEYLNKARKAATSEDFSAARKWVKKAKQLSVPELSKRIKKTNKYIKKKEQERQARFARQERQRREEERQRLARIEAERRRSSGDSSQPRYSIGHIVSSDYGKCKGNYDVIEKQFINVGDGKNVHFNLDCNDSCYTLILVWGDLGEGTATNCGEIKGSWSYACTGGGVSTSPWGTDMNKMVDIIINECR